MKSKLPLVCYYASGCESGKHENPVEATLAPTPFLTADNKTICTKCYNPESHILAAIVIDYRNPPNPYVDYDLMGAAKLLVLVKMLEQLGLLEPLL